MHDRGVHAPADRTLEVVAELRTEGTFSLRISSICGSPFFNDELVPSATAFGFEG